MGFCLTDTPEMGEYGGEVRGESFYLYGEEGDYETGEPAENSIIVFPGNRYSRVPKTLDDEATEQLEWIVTNFMSSFQDKYHANLDPMVKKAIDKLLDDRRVWKQAYEDVRNNQANYGIVEMRIDAIPKVRAVLDAVEEYVERAVRGEG